MRKIIYNTLVSFLFAFLLHSTVVAQETVEVKLIAKSFPLEVTGTVEDAVSGVPLHGVRIEVKGISSAITNEKGEYKIGVPYNSAVLSVYFDGYQERQIPVRGETVKNILLFHEVFSSLKEKREASILTPALVIDDEIQTRFTDDIRTISRSASPAVGANMFIRGFNTLNTNTQPLVVLDGTVWDNSVGYGSVFSGFYMNPLASIDAMDIESIEVIKNASSIYGSKGANGVILIKTIRSRTEVTKISFDAMFGSNLKPKFLPVMDASQYRTYASEIMKGITSEDFIEQAENTFLNVDPSKLNYSTYHNENNWSDDIFRVGNTQRYNFNVKGGDDIAKYAVSLGYASALSPIKETDYSRLNTRINSDINLSKVIKLGTDIYFTRQSRKLFDDGTEERTSPSFLSQIKSPFLVGYNYTALGDKLTNNLADSDVLGISNPLAILDLAKGKNQQYKLGISIFGDWQILNYLKLNARFSSALENTKEHYFIPMKGVQGYYNERHRYIENTIKNKSFSQLSLFGEMSIAYDKVFLDKHNLSASAGMRIYSNSLEYTFGEGHNSGDDKKTNLSNSLAYKKLEGADDDWNSASLFMNVHYLFQEKYDLWSTFAMDASSRFGNETKDGFRMLGGSWGVFPSVGAAWTISSEPFMKSLPFVSLLRVFADYGLTGNDAIGNLYRYSYLRPINYYGVATGLQIDNLGNETLQWETTTKSSLGAEIGLWNDRIRLSGDIYKHQTKNLLTVKEAHRATGRSYYWSNDGELQNTGFSLGVGLKLVNLKDLKWSLEATAAHYKNKITALPDGDYVTSVLGGEILTSVNNPAGLFYGYKTHGVFASNELAKAAYQGVGLKKQNEDASYSYFMAGDIHFEDLDGNGIIDEKDRQIIGDPNPLLTGSLLNSFSVWLFSLNVHFTYSIGNDVYNHHRMLLEGGNSFFNQSMSLLNRWKAEGQITDVPKITYGDPMQNARFSDRWIEDGSFLKLKEVRLICNVPVNVSFLSGITLWMSGTNLYTWTKYLGVDPETSISSSTLYQGIDNGLLSYGRSYYLGVKVNF